MPNTNDIAKTLLIRAAEQLRGVWYTDTNGNIQAHAGAMAARQLLLSMEREISDCSMSWCIQDWDKNVAQWHAYRDRG